MQNPLLTFVRRLTTLVVGSMLCANVYASTASVKDANIGFSQGANAYANARAYSDDNYKQTVLINFGVYSNEQATSVVRTYMPALKSLERSMTIKLGTPVDIRMHIAEDKAQGLDHLINRDVDFAAVDTHDYLDLKEAGIELRVLVAQNTVHTNLLSPWVTRAGLDKSVHDALKDSLLHLNNPKILSSLQLFGFVQSDESQYIGLTNSLLEKNASTDITESDIKVQRQAKRISSSAPNEPVLAAAHSDSPNAATGSNQSYDERDISINIAIPRELLQQAEQTQQKSLNVVIDLNSAATTSATAP